MDSPVSDTDVAIVAAEYLTSWEELSPYLGLTKQHETDIRKDFKEHSNQKRQALLKWKKVKGYAATYRAFITAATKASNEELVDKVKAMLQAKEQPTGKTSPEFFPPVPNCQKYWSMHQIGTGVIVDLASPVYGIPE